MVEKTAITEAIKSIGEVESHFHLRRTEDEQFFTEWYDNLPELTVDDKTSLDVIRRRYLYHFADGNLTQGTVKLLIGSPLLEKAGFYDYPFKMQGVASVEIIFDEDDDLETLRGRIDILVLQNQFWVALLESQRTTISVMSALPQALTYMMANPHPDQPIFGMLINGDSIMFVKLTQQDAPQYDLSRVFAPFTSAKELFTNLETHWSRNRPTTTKIDPSQKSFSLHLLCVFASLREHIFSHAKAQRRKEESRQIHIQILH